MDSGPQEAGLAGFLDRGVQTRGIHLALAEGVEPVDFARSGELYQRHDLLVAGLEAHRGSGGNVEPHAPGLAPLEAERAIHLEEVEVGADLYRPVARVRHGQLDGAAPGIGLDVAITEDVLAWDHSKPPRPTDGPSPCPLPAGGRGREA